MRMIHVRTVCTFVLFVQHLKKMIQIFHSSLFRSRSSRCIKTFTDTQNNWCGAGFGIPSAAGTKHFYNKQYN